MAKPTVAELNTLLLTLVERVNELTAANAALSAEVVRAHGRIDHAGDVFIALRRAVTPLRTKRSARIDRADFDRALHDLRCEANDERATFTREAIMKRHAALTTMVANREAAAAH